MFGRKQKEIISLQAKVSQLNNKLSDMNELFSKLSRIVGEQEFIEMISSVEYKKWLVRDRDNFQKPAEDMLIRGYGYDVAP